MNFNDKQRQYAYSNFTTLDENVRKYLNFKEIKLGDNSIKEVLTAELEYLSLETDSRHIQHVMLCWINKGDLPRNDAKEMKILEKKYKDQTILKIIESRDDLISAD